MVAMPSSANPRALPLRVEALPAELTARPQWVAWRYEKRTPTDEKPTKVPYNPRTGAKARAGDPATWGAIAEAMTACRRWHHSGVGYEQDWEDPFTGIDFDGCRDPETGTIAEWAQADITALDSYSEASPSGTGVRVFVRGRIAGAYLKINQQGRNERLEAYGDGCGVEAYSGKHFLTVTGHHIEGTPATIEERQAALDAFCAKYFPPKAQPAAEAAPRERPALALDDGELVELMCRANPRAAALWSGDISGYASPSQADEALISHLWYWTDGDAEQIERLMHASGLYRPKFDRADYLPISIAAWEADFPNARRRSDDQRHVSLSAAYDMGASDQTATDSPHLDRCSVASDEIPPSEGDELAIVRALREENRRLKEALRIEHEARRMAETALDNLRREVAQERAIESQILATDANDTDKVTLIAMRREMPYEVSDNEGYVSMWMDTTNRETGEKRGWASRIGRSADVVSKRMQRLAAQGAGQWVPGKYDPVTGKSVAPRFKPSPALRDAPLAILYAAEEAGASSAAAPKAPKWGGKRVRICQKCRQAGTLETICKHCGEIQDDAHPVYADAEETPPADVAPDQTTPDFPHLAPTPPASPATADTAPPPAWISSECRNLPISASPTGRPCMKCGTPLRLFPAGGYYPCPSCSAETAKAVGQ